MTSYPGTHYDLVSWGPRIRNYDLVSWERHYDLIPWDAIMTSYLWDAIIMTSYPETPL